MPTLLKFYTPARGRGLNSETIFHKPLQYIGISSCSLFYTQGYHLNSLPSFGLFSCAVRTVTSKVNLENYDMHPLRMPSISTVVHLSMLCHLQTKQTSLLADTSFPWFERRFLFHFNTTKQDRLELCHSKLVSVSVTIQIRSFPLLYMNVFHFLNPHVSKSKTWLVPKPVSNFSRTKYNIQTPLNTDTSLLRTVCFVPWERKPLQFQLH